MGTKGRTNVRYRIGEQLAMIGSQNGSIRSFDDYPSLREVHLRRAAQLSGEM